MNIETIWNTVLNKIKLELSDIAYETWFCDTNLLSLEDKTATILVPTIIHKKHLNDNYFESLEKIFTEVTGTFFKINIILKEEKENNINIGIPHNDYNKTNLNPKYTFEQYVVGESNKFAHAAALAVAENPGKMYNPLFIYGKSGLGKTHLMHSIGNYVSKNTNKRVLYVTSEQFISDFLEINKRDTSGTNFSSVEFFKNKYRNIDLLIIDDIQFLSSAQQTQHEFFHTFNNLYNEEKQIIISSDRSIDDLKILEERLTTRFSWGLTVNIFPPDLELRRNILYNKIIANNLGDSINSEVIEYIASNLNSDIRQLEGAVTRLYAYSTMFNTGKIDMNVAIEALKTTITPSIVFKNDVQKIQQIVCDFYKISLDDMKGKKRTAKIAFPRQVAMYLCRKHTNDSFPKLGIEFGGRDHTTIMHAYSKIEKEIENTQEFAIIIQNFEKQII